ncbi:Methylcrotonoyl-CoA carboxylase beta chain, mitochondrial [Liparis tanakae]|uniref:Methylcrotonoyl-CoA carboxylase beta chain, mitochondrial n=1 Tax=Liparis tanakae TaxID=230148 RepID=A0A4Z2EMD8_9TELE|nr:Methylcrotonoyl-CoA carboxylase beta chain, mitochondrial [Liparis tanakae]
MSSAAGKRRALPSAFPVLEQPLQADHHLVYEANLRNSKACHNQYLELSERVRKGGEEKAIARHTQRHRKLLVRERLRLLLDDEDFLELSPFAGFGLPYGDILSAGTLTEIFPDKNHGGRVFYNEAIMSAMKIPQV